MSKERQASVQQMVGYPPKLLKVDGETYKIGFNDQDAKGRLEEIIGAKVWDRVYAEAERMKPATAERHIARHEQLFASGHYATGGPGWNAEIMSPAGAVLFFLSLLQEHQPDMTPEEAARLFNLEPLRCKHAIAAVAPDFFTAVLRQMGATEEMIERMAPELAKAMAALVEDESQTPEPEPVT